MPKYIDADQMIADFELMAKYQPEWKRSAILGMCATMRWKKGADVVLVRHACWSHLGGDEWCCTECGDVIHTEGSWEKPDKKFCSECGVSMDGEVG